MNCRATFQFLSSPLKIYELFWLYLYQWWDMNQKDGVSCWAAVSRRGFLDGTSASCCGSPGWVSGGLNFDPQCKRLAVKTHGELSAGMGYTSVSFELLQDHAGGFGVNGTVHQRWCNTWVSAKYTGRDREPRSNLSEHREITQWNRNQNSYSKMFICKL